MAKSTAKKSSFKASLKKMNKVYNEAKEKKKEFETDVTPGVYNAKIAKLELKESKSGNLMIARTFVISDGEIAGASFIDFMVLNNEVGIAKAMQFIETLGYETPEKFEEWEQLLEQLNEEPVDVSVKVTQDGDFIKGLVVEVLDSEDEDSEDSEDEDEDEDSEDSEEDEEKKEESLTMDEVPFLLETLDSLLQSTSYPIYTEGSETALVLTQESDAYQIISEAILGTVYSVCEAAGIDAPQVIEESHKSVFLQK